MASGAEGSSSRIASGTDASSTSRSGPIAIPLEPDGLDGRGSAGARAALLPSQGRQPVQGGERPTPPLVSVVVQATPFLHRHEDGDGPVIALDEEALTRGGRVQDGAERSP